MRLRLALLLSAALLAVAAPASAHDASWEDDHAYDADPGGSYSKYCVSDTSLGMGACFQPHGEWWFIVDDASDGYSPVVEWHVDHADGTADDRKGYIWHLKGAYTEAYKNKAHDEDRGIHFRVCRGHHGTHSVYSCSEWRHGLT
jgi:hypothetical protein